MAAGVTLTGVIRDDPCVSVFIRVKLLPLVLLRHCHL